MHWFEVILTSLTLEIELLFIWMFKFWISKSLFKLDYVPQKYECVFILNFCEKLSMRVLQLLKEQVLYPHILIYKDAFLFPINIYYYYAKGMFMVPCSKFQFVHNSNLSFKEELNIFLLDLRSKYVLFLLFLKEISRFQTTCALNICGLILLFCLN